jgi:hypothetical protein
VQVDISTIVATAVLTLLLASVAVLEDLAVLATDLADMANPIVQEEADLVETVMAARV